MARFFFHVVGPEGRKLDRHGVEFDRLELAIDHARRTADEMLHRSSGEEWGPDSAIEITDGSGKVFDTVALSPDDKLNEALEESFPASDPVSMASSLVAGRRHGEPR